MTILRQRILRLHRIQRCCILWHSAEDFPIIGIISLPTTRAYHGLHHTPARSTIQGVDWKKNLILRKVCSVVHQHSIAAIGAGDVYAKGSCPVNKQKLLAYYRMVVGTAVSQFCGRYCHGETIKKFPETILSHNSLSNNARTRPTPGTRGSITPLAIATT
jgi:hypothetical protein